MCGVIDILVGKGVSVGSGGVSESLSCFGGSHGSFRDFESFKNLGSQKVL